MESGRDLIDKDFSTEMIEIELKELLSDCNVSCQTGCIVHTLQLVVRDGLKAVSVILYVHFYYSSILNYSFFVFPFKRGWFQIQ